MAIVVIKIGENEPSSYAKFDKLAHHLDIVDILPRGATTIGKKGDKEFLGLNVDMSGFTQDEFEKIRAILRDEWRELSPTNADSLKFEQIKHKRLRTLDISPSKRSFLGLDNDTVKKIDDMRDYKRAKSASFDMSKINDFTKVISFENFAKTVRHKKSAKYLDEELSLSTQTAKQFLGNDTAYKQLRDGDKITGFSIL